MFNLRSQEKFIYLKISRLKPLYVRIYQQVEHNFAQGKIPSILFHIAGSEY